MYDTLNGGGSAVLPGLISISSISNVCASPLGKSCRSPILSLFLVAKFSQIKMAFLFLVDCDQHRDKGDEVWQEVSAADWKWCIALWIWGMSRLLFTTCVIFPTSTLAQGHLQRAACGKCGERLHRLISGGPPFLRHVRKRREKRASMDQAHGCLGTGPPARPKGTRPGRWWIGFLPSLTAGFLV